MANLPQQSNDQTATEPAAPASMTVIRVWIAIFIVGLVISGVTAFPLRYELGVLDAIIHGARFHSVAPGLLSWVDLIHTALDWSGDRYPFLAYGTDWLGFAHLVIAVAFIGPLMDPVRNIWVLQFGMIACVMVIPFALIAGPARGIPFGWQLIDMSFGIIGIIPLLIAYRLTRRREQLASTAGE